jgi:hypothetical protein
LSPLACGVVVYHWRVMTGVTLNVTLLPHQSCRPSLAPLNEAL